MNIFNIFRLKVKILFYLSTISIVQNNLSQSTIYYNELDEMICKEEVYENKILLLRQIIKIFFNIGILKLSRKKTTLEEIDSIKKDLGISPILMIQSKLILIYNGLFKGIYIFIL